MRANRLTDQQAQARRPGSRTPRPVFETAPVDGVRHGGRGAYTVMMMHGGRGEQEFALSARCGQAHTVAGGGG